MEELTEIGDMVACHRNSRGVTLIEMMLVMTLIALMSAVAYPSVSAGVDSLRLAGAGDSVVSFLNGALVRAERRQELVEVTISKAERTLTMRSSEPGFERTLKLPDTVNVVEVAPDESIVLYPGGTLPRIAVTLENRRGGRRIVRVDPITGVPQIERVVSEK